METYQIQRLGRVDRFGRGLHKDISVKYVSKYLQLDGNICQFSFSLASQWKLPVALATKAH